MPEIVLASASPRRRQLLAQMGLVFRVDPADADETLPQGAEPCRAAEELARRKAATAMKEHPQALVVAADTIVSVGGEILGKPIDEADAARMLEMLQGRTHEVVTGVCAAYGGELHSAFESTLVRFDGMTQEDIAQYVRTGESMDKAGAYGIQGKAGVFISRIEGCYYNVMGLPLAALRKLLVQVVGLDAYRAMTSPADHQQRP